MAEPPDLNALAKRYLDLWQEHLTLTASDPETLEAFGRLFDSLATWAPGPGAVPGVPMPAGQFAWGPSRDHGTDDAARTAKAQTGATTAAAASDDGDGGSDFLNRRIARLEDRIAELESRIAGKGARAPGRSKRR